MNKQILSLALLLIINNCAMIFKSANFKNLSYPIDNQIKNIKKIKCDVRIIDNWNLYPTNININSRLQRSNGHGVNALKKSLDSLRLYYQNSPTTLNNDLDYYCILSISKNREENLFYFIPNVIISGFSFFIIPSYLMNHRDTIKLKIIDMKQGHVTYFTNQIKYNSYLSSLIFLGIWYEYNEVIENIYQNEITTMFNQHYDENFIIEKK
ncbi:MAG: hypothetical protein MH321_10505 [Leptospiraceae bacterium]|nr:hypothetical protein [Leptospiraceae bacterium]